MRRLLSQAPAVLPMRSAGFTMIELITVMVLMGVLAAVAVPRLMDNDPQYRSTAEQLRSNLRYAQRMAATRNRDVCITVTASMVLFRIAPSSGTGVACGATVLTPLDDSAGTLDMVFPAGSPMSFSPAGNFRFTPAGSLANNAGAALPTSTISLLRGASTFATFSIERDNGYVLATNF
ncbi:MAG: methylation [Rhodocyclales bacterium]|nr:methylation [Rhodocyclales bacterium]